MEGRPLGAVPIGVPGRDLYGSCGARMATIAFEGLNDRGAG